MKKLGNFIGGGFAAPTTGAWFSHFNPSTGQAEVEVPDSGVLDVVHALQAANKAFVDWQKVDAAARGRLLWAIAERFEKDAEELARVQSRDQGTPLVFARTESLPRVIEIFRHQARLLGTVSDSSTTTAQAVFLAHRLPIGVVGVITTWSDPFVSLAARVAPALAAGNVVIAKPSELAPESAEAFAATLAQAGLPPGVFNLVQGRGAEVGAAVVAHPGISTLAFTGRTETGRSVWRDSAEFLKRVQLSLGARNPVLIFADGGWEKAVPSIVSVCVSFPGAVCLRGSRLFVQESIYEKFLELFRVQIERVTVGDPLGEETRLGPLVSAGERDRFIEAVRQAIGEKGKLLVGGDDPVEGLDDRLSRGFFVRPTVIHDLTLCSTLQQQEVIGPFVTVSPFKYQHEAIKQANNSPFGQAAYLFQNDAGKAMRVAQKLEAGRVFINAGRALCDERMGFGGLKTSGLGREGGDASLEFFSHRTLIAQNISNL